MPRRRRPEELNQKRQGRVARVRQRTCRVDLRRCFSNPRRPLRTLISRVVKGSHGRRVRPRGPQVTDERGPVCGNSCQSQTRLSASNQEELLAGYAAGVPVQELAVRFQVHRGTVTKLVRQAGLGVRRPAVPEPVRQEAVRLYADGLTLVEVGEQLGINDKTVRLLVIEAGGTLRPRGRRPAHA